MKTPLIISLLFISCSLLSQGKVINEKICIGKHGHDAGEGTYIPKCNNVFEPLAVTFYNSNLPRYSGLNLTFQNSSGQQIGSSQS